MNFRRQPFQFSTIDPAKRHAELQKRFGLPSDEMYVDVNPNIMGAGSREPVLGNSPRLQHRVPLFSQGFDQAKPERCQNVDNEHKPRIRNIPIEVEGAEGTTKRHRTFSGPAGSYTNGFDHSDLNVPTSPFSGRKVPNMCSVNGETTAHPKVCNIPIQIETSKGKKAAKSPEPSTKKEISKPVKINGCSASKPSAEKTPEPVDEKPPEPDVTVPLKQIENVLTKLKTYHEEVEKFSGTAKDKQYRYLDEMLTRCMLDLDNVDTLGMNNVRQSRKSAVRQVQASIDLLESKINAQSNTNTIEDSAVLNNSDVEMKESSVDKDMQDNSVSAESDSIMEASESVSQAMETSESEPVPSEKIESMVDQPVGDSVTLSTGHHGVGAQTEDTATKTAVENEMEIEKPGETSVIIEEVSDTAISEMEESNETEIIPVEQVVEGPMVEMETTSNEVENTQSETVQEPVMQTETLDIQIEDATEPVSEPLVTEPVESSEQTNLTIPNRDSAVVHTEIVELEQPVIENSDMVVTEVTEISNKNLNNKEFEQPVVESSNTVVTEVTEISSEDLNDSIDCAPTLVEETHEVQAVSEKCDSNVSS